LCSGTVVCRWLPLARRCQSPNVGLAFPIVVEFWVDP
jgi:hypothetical protein